MEPLDMLVRRLSLQAELSDDDTSVHVNRMLKALAENGLITRTGRMVSILNWTGLGDATGFDSRYLHLERQRTAA